MQHFAHSEEFDVIVVGGGPAGSTAATLTALDGHRVLLLEKEEFPRYQIGESLLPSTIHGICPLLGVYDEVQKAGFTRKHGGTFKWGANPEPWTFSFAVSPRMAGPTSYAYQVERMKFDKILLDNAAKVGVDVRQRHRVLEVTSSGSRVDGVRYADADGEERSATARFVIDASGNTSRIHHAAQGQREYSPFFRNLALFGYFRGGARLPEPNSGNIFSVAFPSGWFWYIPLSPDLTSVGAVVKREMAVKVQGDPEEAFAALIAECPEISELLRDAERATEQPYDQLRVRKDYSYDRTSMWSPGMVLIGDAACFIDPVFSSGVHLATYSGLLAARSINSVLAGTAEEKRCFDEFEARYRREFGLFRDFLMAFYDHHQDEESYFWTARKVAGHAGSREEAFVDLVGGVTATDFSRASAAMERRHMEEVLAEGSQLQMRGLLGEEAGNEPPLFPGGLVSSPTGRRWIDLDAPADNA
jgi:halogenation protein CepH